MLYNHINDLAPDDVKGKWQVAVQDNTVAFGASRDNWALSFKRMKDTGYYVLQSCHTYLVTG